MLSNVERGRQNRRRLLDGGHQPCTTKYAYIGEPGTGSPELAGGTSSVPGASVPCSPSASTSRAGRFHRTRHTGSGPSDQAIIHDSCHSGEAGVQSIASVLRATLSYASNRVNQ